jgi:phosphatidyl-myo-inositol alpha-mannosyltransferase
VRIGIVCPYSFDVPGGVQSHVLELAEALIGLGHEVSVLAPADDDAQLPPYVVSAGRAVPLPYNGSVARIAFGPISSARVRRWLARGDFEVLHVHEPLTLSLSMVAVLSSDGPVVATFHTAIPRSRLLDTFESFLRITLERITSRIAVSALARKVQVEHLDGGAVEIPNGVAVGRFASASALPGWPGEGGAIGFLGRFTEPRKGFPLVRDAFVSLAERRPGLRLLVAGPGAADELYEGIPDGLRDRVVFLGKVSEDDKARMLSSVDIYVAPNTGGESFGIILTEAMAAGATVVASDIDAFRRVLDGGRAGRLFQVGSVPALTAALDDLLDAPDQRAALVACAREAVARFDWPVVARQVLEVYATAIEATDGRVVDVEWAPPRS